ncbi:MAG: ABC transporter ATP-binding protein [Myxococcaceae bacterium]|nr:MAG: ABC transporter ATP-binding protein [Myxococcaceae bacterium]
MTALTAQELPEAFSTAWPFERLSDAVLLLARRTGFVAEPREALALDRQMAPHDIAGIHRWFQYAADALQVEMQLVSSRYEDVDGLASRCAPAIIRLKAPIADEYRFLVILRTDPKHFTVLLPDGREQTLPVPSLRAARFAAFEEEIDTWLAKHLGPLAARVERGSQEAVRLRAEFRSDLTLTNCWLLRPVPGRTSLKTLLKRERILPKLGALLMVHGAMALVAVLMWMNLGTNALAGHKPDGWHVAWGLLVLLQVPLMSRGEFLQSLLGLLLGRQFKQHLLHGAFRMDPDVVRQQGSGALLSAVFESESMEMLALETGFQAFAMIINLILVPLVLLAGAAPTAQVGLFLGFAVFIVALASWHLRARERWTRARQSLTQDLVEKLSGQRTRLAQQPRSLWHAGEDAQLASYARLSRPMDASRLWLVYAARAWFVLALAVLGPALVSGASPGLVATSVGGLLLGWGTLQQLGQGGLTAGSAVVAWRSIASLFRAARSEQNSTGERGGIILDKPSGTGEVVVQARDLVFRHPSRVRPVLDGCSFKILAGDRILLQGASGGGKTTLAALLAGLRRQDSGLLLLRGVDRATLGDREFRERIVLVPQFHENHIFAASLAFNLLMGRRWPADPADLREAETVCQELGLGPLLERMPGGLNEMVGDAGWQLSHGEKSRVFLARALLQDADVIILDESFAALDPDTLGKVMACVDARARTLMLIAHP